MAGRQKRTREQLLKEAAEADREAILLSQSMAGMRGRDAIARSRQLQDLYNKARSLRVLAQER